MSIHASSLSVFVSKMAGCVGFVLYNSPAGCGMGFWAWCGVALLLLLCLELWLNNEW